MLVLLGGKRVSPKECRRMIACAACERQALEPFCPATVERETSLLVASRILLIIIIMWSQPHSPEPQPLGMPNVRMLQHQSNAHAVFRIRSHGTVYWRYQANLLVDRTPNMEHDRRPNIISKNERYDGRLSIA